ncbi:putative ABC transport system permease protein [Azospirillum agricola]|uniref:ABC transporter permease n=1 Tax=Azospirillum agricola TaxID=1720247 RepID=UPI001AE5DD9D|nr:FtsX-like permease family protein [Azospirillum agricola]MBP2230942.1 putative ABC transport system permease protein [Azospirillum agricola]
MTFLRIALRLAWRDLRGGTAGLWIVVLGVALGTAMMAAVGSLGGAVLDGMQASAREAVGGDLSVRLFHAPATPEQRAFLEAAGTVSETAELRPAAGTVSGSARILVELKAVDGAYPLVGAATVSGAASLAAAVAHRDGFWGAAVSADLLDALRLGIGDRLRIGVGEVVIRAVLGHEPDRAFRAFSLGPRVVVARPALAATGLAGPGAPVYWYYRLLLPEKGRSGTVLRDLERRFPDAGWRIVDAAHGIPGVDRTVQLARTLLLLGALSITLVGGVGIGRALSAHLDRRLPVIAALKASGGSPRLLFTAFLLQTLFVVAVALLIGLAAGAGLAGAVAHALPLDWLPETAGALHPPAFLLSATVSLLAALLCALPPLGRAVGTSPAAIWRSPGSPPRQWRGWRHGWRIRMAVGVLGLSLAGLLAAWTGMPLAVAGFLSVAGAVAAGFALLGHGLALAARRLARGRGPLVRLAVANLGRPGAPTVPVAVALGVGLTVLVAVGVTGTAAVEHVEATLPAETPSLIFLNVAPHADRNVRERLSALSGVERVETAPFLHARISRVNGIPVTEADVPRSVAWAVRGDRGLSWRDRPAATDRVVAGTWWPPAYDGPPLASLDAQVAGRLGLAVGDTVTLALADGPLTATVANLRRIDWTRLDLDFPVILSPFAEPPRHSLVAAVWSGAAAVPAVEAAMATAVPDAAALRTAGLLRTLRSTVDQVRRLLDGLSFVALGASGLVLLGAIANSARRRLHEMAILHALGIGRRSIGLAVVLEFSLLGAAVAAVAAPLGWLGGTAVVAGVTDAGSAAGGMVAVAAFLAAPVGMAAAGAGLAAGLRGTDALRRLRGNALD